MQYSTTGGISPAAPLANYLYPNKWLKLQRVGNTFTGYQSLDGVTWNLIGKKTFPMATTVTVGLFVTSHNTGQYSSVGFDNVSVTGAVTLPPNDFSISASPTTVSVAAGTSGSTSISTALVSGSAESITLSTSGLPAGVTAGFSPNTITAGASSSLTLGVAGSVAPGTYPITITGTATSATHSTPLSLTVTAPGALPSPWADTDVGAPSPAGSASFSGGVFSVNGSGADIFGTSDQFNYVYQPTTGDGTIIARVVSQSATGSSNSKAGVIWKASTTAGSPYILIETGPTGVVKVQYNFNGSLSTTATYSFPNIWMKLVRSSGNFSAYVSPDGVTWTAVVTNKSLSTIPTAATVGIFECSHKAGVLGTATFDNVSFTPGP
jgi:regulation of enolase protein 1 (concanavalin A-like superfamily)